jgi:CheY-like chemotaxis protein
MTTHAPIILIVDDDLPTLILLRRLLLTLVPHAEVIAVNNGVAALDVIAASTVMLVITDYKMPGMNGMQLTETIKAESPTTIVAIITVYDLADVAQAAKVVAADYVLPKPFVVAQLKELIDACIPRAAGDRSAHEERSP